jgi:predicted Fe-S protein YdhL (DUF1289 family)
MKSQCIRDCTLNEKDICVGCGRSLEDILSWTSYTDEQRDALMLESMKRKEGLLRKSSMQRIDPKKTC